MIDIIVLGFLLLAAIFVCAKFGVNSKGGFAFAICLAWLCFLVERAVGQPYVESLFPLLGLLVLLYSSIKDIKRGGEKE
ncbi:MAG: hypothetical protein CME65_12375 [Halobacteriovoraceae bacterium]|nr:hypothetical protein [Halobacteriovoraceae bacterium]|tara:strand:- start:7546 stop:7782 length:237 start_codon:yes stop_codon:yes gene_type:complete